MRNNELEILLYHIIFQRANCCLMRLALSIRKFVSYGADCLKMLYLKV